MLPESEACVPNAALSSRSVRRLVLKDLEKGRALQVLGLAAHRPNILSPAISSRQTRQLAVSRPPRTTKVQNKAGTHLPPAPLTGQRGPWCPQLAAGQSPAAVPGRAPPLRGQAASGFGGVSPPRPVGPAEPRGSESWGPWGSRRRVWPKRGTTTMPHLPQPHVQAKAPPHHDEAGSEGLCVDKEMWLSPE